MKKYLTLILAAMILLLAGCKKESDEDLLIDDPEPETMETASAAESASAAETVPPEETRILTPETEPEETIPEVVEWEIGSRDYDLIAGMSDSFSRALRSSAALYYTEGVMKGENYLQFIRRADLSSGESRFYCRKPGCSHDSAECEAYFDGSLVQIYDNRLILQDSTPGSSLNLDSIPIGYQGERETFLKIPFTEIKERLDMDIPYLWPQVVLHRDTAVICLTEQGEFTGTGYEREGAEDAAVPDWAEETKKSFESRYDYKALVCVYPFGTEGSGKVIPLVEREIPDVSNVFIEVLPCGDDIYILLEEMLSEAYFEGDSSGGGGSACEHLKEMEIYRYRIGTENAELLFQGPAPFDGLCGTTADGSAIRFLALRDAMEEEADGFCDYLLTGFDLAEKRFYDPVSLFREDDYASRPRFGEGYIAAVSFKDPSLVSRGMIGNAALKDFGASKIHIYNFSGKEEQVFDFDMLVPESVGKAMEIHCVPLLTGCYAEEMMILGGDYSAYHAKSIRLLMSLRDGELLTLHEKNQGE